MEREPTEQMEIELLPLADLKRDILLGRFQSGPSALALLLASGLVPRMTKIRKETGNPSRRLSLRSRYQSRYHLAATSIVVVSPFSTWTSHR